jgi:hypothetical protein
MNEETIASIVGWGKTLGCIASSISVNLPELGHIHRGGATLRLKRELRLTCIR